MSPENLLQYILLWGNSLTDWITTGPGQKEKKKTLNNLPLGTAFVCLAQWDQFLASNVHSG